MTAVLDTKPYIEYEPQIGYRYIPNTRQTLPRPGGGHYELQANSIGIRSSMEYSRAKPPGVYRIIILGDSFAAGQFVSNDQRFSEILERRMPGVEVMNLALEGTGTDQQLLIYEKIGLQFEHDLVILLPFLQNIRRNLVEVREAHDPKTGEKTLRAKPRFELQDNELKLLNVPVPAGRNVVHGEQAWQSTDNDSGYLSILKARLSQMPIMDFVKRWAYSLRPWEPFPEYRSATSPPWLLMEAILRRLKASMGSRPLVIAPVFYASYVKYRMARNYWDRFSALEAVPGIQAIDLLPHYRRIGREAIRCFFEPYDCHYSPYGNLILADMLQQELSLRGLLAG